MSTSGNSEDLVLGLREARRRGALTVGFSGYDGGRLATSPDVDHCFIGQDVRSLLGEAADFLAEALR